MMLTDIEVVPKFTKIKSYNKSVCQSEYTSGQKYYKFIMYFFSIFTQIILCMSIYVIGFIK